MDFRRGRRQVATVAEVKESCAAVTARARQVTVDPAAVRRWAKRLAGEPRAVDALDPDLALRGTPEECANHALLTDCLNFCFWAEEPWEVDYRGRTWTRTPAMLASVRRAIEQDPAWLTARRWATVGRSEVEAVFRGRGVIPLIEQRVRILAETGTVLEREYGGQFANAVEEADGQADGLAELLAERFPSFRDVAKYDGREVAFLKRAQICAADLHRGWTANGYAGLAGMDQLTVFADYRLPQLFRHESLLLLAPALAGRIDRQENIAAGSPEEVELRAATVQIGQMLADELTALGQAIAPWQLDYDLWLRARRPEVTVPHHRTITWYY